MFRKLKLLWYSKNKTRDISIYFEGTFRLWLYYSKFKWLMRSHILEQIEYRVKMMDKQCYEQGYCKMCGCDTLGLQMASRSCDAFCYPPLVSKSKWEDFKLGSVIVSNDGFWTINIATREPMFFKVKDDNYVRANFTGLRNYKS